MEIENIIQYCLNKRKNEKVYIIIGIMKEVVNTDKEFSIERM